MKTILNKEGADDLIARVGKLATTSTPSWGLMNVTEMLHHCNRATQLILDGQGIPKLSTTKQKLLKFLFLNVIKKLPKNAAAPKRIDVKRNQLMPADFETERQEFVNLVQRFTARKTEINLSHPSFGALSTREWGYFVWMHLDHHLRQFGV